jgi:hypothetical protein
LTKADQKSIWSSRKPRLTRMPARTTATTAARNGSTPITETACINAVNHVDPNDCRNRMGSVWDIPASAPPIPAPQGDRHPRIRSAR